MATAEEIAAALAALRDTWARDHQLKDASNERRLLRAGRAVEEATHEALAR